MSVRKSLNQQWLVVVCPPRCQVKEVRNDNRWVRSGQERVGRKSKSTYVITYASEWMKRGEKWQQEKPFDPILISHNVRLSLCPFSLASSPGISSIYRWEEIKRENVSILSPISNIEDHTGKLGVPISLVGNVVELKRRRERQRCRQKR